MGTKTKDRDMKKFTETQIFRKAKSAFDIAAILSIIFWVPIVVILFGALFIWK